MVDLRSTAIVYLGVSSLPSRVRNSSAGFRFKSYHTHAQTDTTENNTTSRVVNTNNIMPSKENTRGQEAELPLICSRIRADASCI